VLHLGQVEGLELVPGSRIWMILLVLEWMLVVWFWMILLVSESAL
jgi:hypothetical protein